MNITGLWDQLVDCICRPPRDKYTAVDLPGGVAGTFKLKGKEYLRKDVQLENAHKQQIKCSHLVPKYPPESKEGKLPCVVYCHCNSGSRRDSEEALHLLLPQNITVFALDFAGSGQSDGKYVTLGWREQDDLALAIEHLRGLGTVSTIGLWGRSMGAVTALLYSQKDPSIAGVVVDSPFSKLTELMLELVEEQKIPIPRSLMRVALSMMRRSVKKRAGFSIDEVAPIDQIHKSFIPVLFGHAIEDTFVAKIHSEKLLAKYGSEDKELMLFEGDHNSIRPRAFYAKVLLFFHNCLQCQDVLIPDEQNPGQFELAMEDAARVTENMDPPALSRTTSPVWGDMPSYLGNAEQLQEYLTDELNNVKNGHADLPSQQEASSTQPDGTTAETHRHQLRQEGQPAQTLTEDDALARALELSLMEVQQQEHGHVPGNGAQPAAAASTTLQDTVPQDMQQMAPEDAEEAMLAAAIRASLIEAGEPDTNQSQPAQSSKRHGTQQHKPLDQHQDGLPSQSSAFAQPLHQPSPFQQQSMPQQQERQHQHQHQQPSQMQSQQQQQQPQQQQPQQQQVWLQQQGHSMGFGEAASQVGDLASALQDSASSQGMSQGVALHRPSKGSGRVTWLSPEPISDRPPGQMRPSKSSHALLQMNGDADRMLSSGAEGDLIDGRQAAVQGDKSAKQQAEVSNLRRAHSNVFDGAPLGQHEQSSLLTRPHSITRMLSNSKESGDQVAKQVFTQSPLYAGKQGNTAGGRSLLQVLSSGNQRDHNIQGAKTDDAFAAVEPNNGKQLVTEAESAPSPSQYPDTPLYQFADIELAHHHHHV